MSYVRLKAEELEINVFDKIGSGWMLLTAGDAARLNTMTVSWGGLGVLWGMNVATCYVRPQRHTFGFMESGEYFTLSAYPDELKKKLSLCGSKSGRDVNKVEQCGFTPVFADCGAPYFNDAELVFVCRKLYYSDLDPKNFIDKGIEKHYENGDYHRMYIGEIVEILKKE